MAKREFAHPNEMHKYVGQEIGVSDWVEVTQERINQFAEATGDHQWIHVDVERAKKDMPGGKTIAHGFLTLSLIPMLNHQISHINNVRNGINYGCNKVRFTSPVPAGSKVRARAKLIAADPMTGRRRAAHQPGHHRDRGTGASGLRGRDHVHRLRRLRESGSCSSVKN